MRACTACGKLGATVASRRSADRSRRYAPVLRQRLSARAAFPGRDAMTACTNRPPREDALAVHETASDRKSTRLNSSHGYISYAVFCLKKKKKNQKNKHH